MTAPLIFSPEYYARMRELERVSWWNAALRDAAAGLLATNRLPDEGVLLDVGCGSGQTMTWFAAQHPGWRTVGLDISWDAVRAAQAIRPGQVARASATALPVADQMATVVITLDVLQHLPLDDGDIRALAEFRRVLKPGGLLLVRTNAQMFPHTPDDPAHAFHKYEPSELRAKLTKVGFVVCRLGRLNALLGLAEIPRELRARRSEQSSYHGILATARREPPWVFNLKRRWLRWEGHLMARGFQWPFGRTILALCRTPGLPEPGNR